VYSKGKTLGLATFAWTAFLAFGSVLFAAEPKATLGSAKAPIIIVEFSDYQCPYCQRFYETTFANLRQTYIDSGVVQYIVRDNPLPIHNLSRLAAHSAHCAEDQGRFWDYHIELLKQGDRLDRSVFDNLAKQIGLNANAFDNCMTAGSHFDQIDSDAKVAEANGIAGRPTFLVARRADDAFAGERIVGAQPYSEFVTIIESVRRRKD